VAYALQCMEPTVFNWRVGFLQNVKEKILRCRMGQQKKFEYGLFLVSFFLKCIPLMQPQIALVVRPVGEPCMERWKSLSLRLGTESEFRFIGDLFAWLRRQLIIIEDFPYTGVNFWGSMDLVLSDGMDWDTSGKKPKQSCQVFFLF
jgi:hypothetical protein